MRFGSWIPGGRNLVAIFAIAALLFSSIIVQGHVHPGLGALAGHQSAGTATSIDAGPAGIASSDARLVPAPPARKAGGAPDCYLCQAALGAAATFSSPVTLLIHFSSVLNGDDTGSSPAPTEALRSHAWHSRAPPLFS